MEMRCWVSKASASVASADGG